MRWPFRLRSSWLGLLVWACVSAILLAALPVSAEQQASPELRRILEGAKTEGTVTLFIGSGKFSADDEQTISRAFEKKFGFPLKVRFDSSGGHVPVISKLLVEAKAGVPPAIDVFVTGPNLLKRLGGGGLIVPVDWASLGVQAEDILTQFHAAYVRDILRTVVYNTNLVSAQEAPRQYQDLLNPKWKGKIVAPTFPAHWAYPAFIMGEEKAKQLAKTLVEEQALALVPTYTDVPARVATGEFAIGIGLDAAVPKRKGAAIENAPMERVAFIPTYGVVLKGSGRLAAAHALTYFLVATPEGKRVMEDVLLWSKHTTPGTEAYQVAGGGKGALPPIDWFVNEEPRLSKEFGLLMGKR